MEKLWKSCGKAAERIFLYLDKMKKTLAINMSKCKIPKNDIFYTPSTVVDDCMKLISIKESDILLDPFNGDGAFYNKFPDINTKFWCEIEKGVDFWTIIKKLIGSYRIHLFQN